LANQGLRYLTRIGGTSAALEVEGRREQAVHADSVDSGRCFRVKAAIDSGASRPEWFGIRNVPELVTKLLQ
jgi:hypothetical protein